MRAKRKLADMNDTGESPSLDSQKLSLLSQIDNMSPVSSPLKGPLVEDDSGETGSPSFAAKCFYGLKSSTVSKENHLSPKQKNLRKQQPSAGDKPSILQDSHLNEKLLARIADSPIKQAVLRRCSLDEFRKLYRDEIKEIEQEDKLAERRITRTLSKIVWKQNEDDDDIWGDDDSSDDGISFQITNRGFDVDSISNGSSSIKSQDDMTPVKKDNGCSAAIVSENAEYVEQKTLMKTPPSTVSSSERKFFKSKSVGKSVGTSNVLLGKGFNLRFVRQSRSCSTKKKGKKNANVTPKSNGAKKPNFTEKLKLSYQSPLGSTVQTASGTGSSQDSSSQVTSSMDSNIFKVNKPEKYSGEGFDDDGDIIEVNKDSSKTYELKSPKRQRLDYNSSGNESPYDSMSDHSPISQDSTNDLSNFKQDTEVKMSNSNDDSCNKKNDDGSSKKFFPIFRTPQRACQLKTKSNPSVMKSSKLVKAGKDDKNQLVIDAGQKKFGATQCNVCGMVYCLEDLTDQTAHAKFHKRLIEVLKFPGWKKERVLQEDPLDCGRVILVLSDDPKSHRKKVEEIYEVMGRELGFPGATAFTSPFQKVFLYVSVDKEIEGCCVAEPIREGNRVIPGDLDTNDASGRRPWCCEKVPEPALIGISRLWVAAQKRRNGVASRLMEAVQQWFDYGSLIPKDKIAFSDPTPDGRRFAQKFMGTPTFLVYKYK